MKHQRSGRAWRDVTNDERFYNFARDFFGVRKSEMSQDMIPPEASTPEASLPLPELLAVKIKQCLAHVRAVQWGEGSADFEIDDGHARLLVRMSVKVIAAVKADKKP